MIPNDTPLSSEVFFNKVLQIIIAPYLKQFRKLFEEARYYLTKHYDYDALGWDKFEKLSQSAVT